MFVYTAVGTGVILLAGIVGGRIVLAADPVTWDGKIVQYGKMHEAIGAQKHEGRVKLAKLLQQRHFFGVAAMEGLEGEATIFDGKVTVTRVDSKGRLQPVEPAPLDGSATLLVGAYVPSWGEHKVTTNVPADQLDPFVDKLAAKAGVKTSQPFVFTIEGEFSNLRLHVINGACPMHARLKKIEIPTDRQPAEVQLEKVRGTLVGVFAKDALGSITHPATSTHMHLLFQDPASGKTVTGHVEQIGLRKGTVVRLPK